MIEIPDNFPSYTSYSPKMLIQHVDQLKAAMRELQASMTELEQSLAQLKMPKPKADKPTTDKTTV